MSQHLKQEGPAQTMGMPRSSIPVNHTKISYPYECLCIISWELRHCPQAGEPFSYFRTSGLCVICNYVLHTLEYCTSSTRRILMFLLSHFQKTELKFGGINSNGLTNELSSSFLFSRKVLSFSYLVPLYHKYLGSTYKKPLFKMKSGQFQGGSGLMSQLKQGCASPDSGLHKGRRDITIRTPYVGVNT